jgi:hypothetical protein
MATGSALRTLTEMSRMHDFREKMTVEKFIMHLKEA